MKTFALWLKLVDIHLVNAERVHIRLIKPSLVSMVAFNIETIHLLLHNLHVLVTLVGIDGRLHFGLAVHLAL